MEEMDLVRIFLATCKGNMTKKLISRLYTNLQVLRKILTPYIKDRWKKEIKEDISNNNWFNICKTIVTTSCSDFWRVCLEKHYEIFYYNKHVK